MNWLIKHLTDDITMHDVADHVHVSPFYFHKGFQILCGYSVTEYIRNRRLSLAGQELLTKDLTVMELAMKYGYDSPDSFTKAFTRFHGHSPSDVRRRSFVTKMRNRRFPCFGRSILRQKTGNMSVECLGSILIRR